VALNSVLLIIISVREEIMTEIMSLAVQFDESLNLHIALWPAQEVAEVIMGVEFCSITMLMPDAGTSSQDTDTKYKPLLKAV